MFGLARYYVNRGRFGLPLAFLILCAAAYGAIWFAIEPLGIAEILALELPRWGLHILLSVVFGLIMAFHLRMAPQEKQVLDFKYRVSESPRFYDVIANHYDKRNSNSLLKTHEKVVDRLRSFASQRPNLTIADLGGGTGKGIAHHFFREPNFRWEYVDASAQMAQQFQANMSGTVLPCNVNLKTIDNYLVSAVSSTFDVVLLSLVLTSLEVDPDWGKIAKILKPGGRLIIADIDAIYTAVNPYYVIECDDRRHGLEPRPIPLAKLIDTINKRHLIFDHSYAIGNGPRSYAFVAEFIKS